MKSQELYEAFSYVDDKYLDMVDTLQKEQMKMKHISFRKAITFALAAAFCISILGITAMASGWIPNIFKLVYQYNPDAGTVFEEAVQLTEAQTPEIVEIPEMDLSKLTLSERYYDGTAILLGYNLEEIVPEPVVGYEPDENLLAEIKEIPEYLHTPAPGKDTDTLEKYLELGFLTQEDYDSILDNRSEYAKEHDIRYYENIMMDLELQEILTAEQYEQFWTEMEEKGCACVVTQEVHIGDHKYVNKEDVGRNNVRQYETDAGTCLHLEPLPQKAQGQESVTVELTLKSNNIYWYMELDGYCYQIYKPNQEKTVSFTLENVNNN